jgi:hypothetical protein
MRRARSAVVILCLVSLGLFGCNGAMNFSPPPPPPPAANNSAPVSITITDAPPANVTILSFEVTVTSATLNPGSVPLISSPRIIEVKELEADSAFLSTLNVPTGTYQSITVNFANPEITFLNQTGAVLAGCANNTVCEIQSNNAGSATYSGAPFPVTITTGVASALRLDVNVANVITPTLGVDFSAANAVTVQQLATHGSGETDEMDDLVGVVQNPNLLNQNFTLHTMHGDFLITTDANTEYEIHGCSASNFNCLQTGQVVQVDVRLLTGGVMDAKRIELDDEVEDNEAEGVVTKIDDATHFEMVVLDELPLTANVNIGNPITVTLSSASFQIKSDGLSVPSALQNAFQAATTTSQLLPGQVVEVRVTSFAAGPPISVTTDRVRLSMTQFTGIVMAIALPNFTLGSLPAIFTNAGINSIVVVTSNQTDVDGSTNINALLDGNTVSTRGLLFKNGANPPEMIAKKVRIR